MEQEQLRRRDRWKTWDPLALLLLGIVWAFFGLVCILTGFVGSRIAFIAGVLGLVLGGFWLRRWQQVRPSR